MYYSTFFYLKLNLNTLTAFWDAQHLRSFYIAENIRKGPKRSKEKSDFALLTWGGWAVAGAVHQTAPLVTSAPSAAEQTGTWEMLHSGFQHAVPAYHEAARKVPWREVIRERSNISIWDRGSELIEPWLDFPALIVLFSLNRTEVACLRRVRLETWRGRGRDAG